MASKPKRVRRTRSDWQQIINRQSSSGLTQRDYCDQNGISLHSFRPWKQRLSKEEKAEPNGNEETQSRVDSWLALSTHSDKGPQKAKGWDIELDLGQGVCLRLRSA